MRTEICPTHGDFCTSFETQIHIESDVEVLEHDSLGRGKLALKEGTTRLLPVQHLIQLLKDADRKLQGVHAHPRDLTIVGVRTEDAEALTLLVARKASRQRRLDEDLADETQAEREAAKAMVHRISPLVNLLQEKRLSTEQLCTALSAEADPARARAAFVSLGSVVNELIKMGQLEPQQIREWFGLPQQQAHKDALEPFEARLREFERRAA